MIPEKRSITPEKAVHILKKSGIEVSLEEANEILRFLYLLAEIMVKRHGKPTAQTEKICR